MAVVLKKWAGNAVSPATGPDHTKGYFAWRPEQISHQMFAVNFLNTIQTQEFSLGKRWGLKCLKIMVLADLPETLRDGMRNSLVNLRLIILATAGGEPARCLE